MTRMGHLVGPDHIRSLIFLPVSLQIDNRHFLLIKNAWRGVRKDTIERSITDLVLKVGFVSESTLAFESQVALALVQILVATLEYG
jgi:hypothetical protein